MSRKIVLHDKTAVILAVRLKVKVGFCGAKHVKRWADWRSATSAAL